MFQQLSNHKQKNKKYYPNTNLSKETDWWVIRKKMMNKWISKPDWCCSQIRRYLGNIQYSDKTKLQTVSFYLSLSGFRSGAINYPCVIKLKQDVFNEIKNRKNKGQWC